MTELKQVIMQRDDLTSEEADNLIAEAKTALIGYLDNNDLTSADEICEEYFGLEPDYIFDLL